MEDDLGTPVRTLESLKLLSFSKANGVARVILNRPPYNVMNIALLDELASVLDAIELAGDTKVLVLSGTDAAFSGGLDITDHTEEKAYQLIESFHTVFRKLMKLEAVTIALVKGMALGGGCELAVACDFTFVAEDAKLGQPEIKVGLFAPLAAILYPHLIGRHRTFEMMLSGEVLVGKDAAQMGLVTKALPAGELEAELQRWLDRLALSSTPVVQLTRRALQEASGQPFDEALRRVEEIYLNYLMATEDTHEGLAAFLQKRKPVWKNR
jgi:cyclohexa-1,5-dienecarbonyl-CoA hydratase